MDCVLVIDQGTTSTRVLLYDSQLQVIDTANIAVDLSTQGFEVELDAQDLWLGVETSLLAVLARTMASNNAKQIALINADLASSLQESEALSLDIVGLGITNQRETIVAWDKTTGLPLAPAIVWQDSRTAAFCEAHKGSDWEQEVQATTGLLLDPYFSGTKMRWLLQNNSQVQEAQAQGNLAFGTIDSWLLYKLSGQHLCEATNASRTLCYDINTGRYASTMLEKLGIPAQTLPDICASYGHIATARLSTARVSTAHLTASGTTLAQGQDASISIPILGVAGDQQASLIGHNALHQGAAKCTFGTGAFMLAYTGDKPVFSAHKLLTTVAYASPQGDIQYAMEGSCFSAGTAVNWAIDNLNLADNVKDLNALIQGCTDAEGVYFVPALVGLGAPWWRAEARASFVGMKQDTTKQHLAVAVMQGIILQVKDLIEQGFKADGVPIDKLYCDGGLLRSPWFAQQLADILQLNIHVPADVECTALGAAKLCARTLDWDLDWDETQANAPQVYKPQWSQAHSDSFYKVWLEGLHKYYL